MESVLALLMGVIPFCFCVLGLAVLGALMVWVIYRQWQPKSKAALADQKKAAQAWLQQAAVGLRPWSADALGDLSTDWDATWSKLGRDLDARGTLPSLADPKGVKWVAFNLKVRGARQPDGQLHACTTAQTFYYRILGEEVELWVNDKPLGKVKPDGALVDEIGEPIGSAQRPAGEAVKVGLGGIERMLDRRERAYSVILKDRAVAQLAHPPAQMMNVIPLTKEEHAPAVVVEAELSEWEAAWVLALAILQVAYRNLMETVWTN